MARKKITPASEHARIRVGTPTPESEKAGITPEREAEIAKETQTAIETARASEEKRQENNRPIEPKPAATPKKRAVRDPKTGRAAKAGTVAPTPVPEVPVNTAADPNRTTPTGKKFKTLTAVTGETIRPATNTELKKGIPSVVVRDQTKPTTPAAGPRLPRIGQIYKHSDGRMMRVSAENINEVHADAKKTVLPEAGPEVMVQPGRPAPLPGPRGGLRPNIPRNNRGNRGGLGVAHATAKEHADRALGHLDAMAAAEHGSGPYRQAQKSFQVVHGAIGQQNMSKSIHTMLQLAHNHIDSKLPGTEKMLNATREAVGDTLRAGKRAEEERAFRQMQTDKGGN